MNRLLIGTAAAVLLGLSPALAAEDSNMTATQPGVSQETSKQAHQPPTGSADTSGGAAEQSSAPPSSGAASATEPSEGAINPDQGSADQSRGQGAKLSTSWLVCGRYRQAESDPRWRKLQGVMGRVG